MADTDFKLSYQLDMNAINYLLVNYSVNDLLSLNNVFEILKELNLASEITKGLYSLTEYGKLFVGATTTTNLYTNFEVNITEPSRAVFVYNLYRPLFLVYKDILQLMKDNIPEFQDRSQASTKIYNGIELVEIKSIILLTICLKDYDAKDSLAILISQKDVSISLKNVIKDNSKVLKRAHEFINILLKSNIITEDETKTMFVDISNYLSSNPKNKFIKEYNGPKDDKSLSRHDYMKKKIVEYVSRRESVSRKQIQSYFGFSERYINRFLKELVEEQQIVTTSSKYNPKVEYSINRDFRD